MSKAHPWSLPFVKHEANIMINLNMCRLQCIGSGVFSHLLFKNGKNLTHINRHNSITLSRNTCIILLLFLIDIFMNINYQVANILGIIYELFMSGKEIMSTCRCRCDIPYALFKSEC